MLRAEGGTEEWRHTLNLNLRAGRESWKDGLTCQPSGLGQEACVPLDSSRGIILFNSFEYDFFALLLKGSVRFTLDNYQ